MSAQYWIAQHVEDLFRNEPRNVGVFVRLHGQVVARFFGEDANGDIDGRRLRALPYPDVYRQWISYWRRDLGAQGVDPLLAGGASNYRVVAGGQVSDIGSDSAADVTNYLYSMLVSEGGFREALASSEQNDAVAAAIQLSAEVSEALDQAQLLFRDERAPPLVRHPVRRGAELRGVVAPYRPAFTQENGRLYVMETVDFTRAKKAAARDHAGWSAYMFRDIRHARPNSVPIAIVKLMEADHNIEEVQSGLAVLRNEGEIVHWINDQERATFLEERRRIALG
jgi:hypothetical protein